MKGKANIILGTVIILVLAVAIGTFASSQIKGASADELQAVVHDGDGNETRLSLSEDQQFAVQTSLGENVVVVEDGNVYVREADCLNQDCVHQGKIDSPGKQIICLPHKLWIEIVGAGNASTTEMDVDAVAGESVVSDEGTETSEGIVADEDTEAGEDSETEDLDVVAR